MLHAGMKEAKKPMALSNPAPPSQRWAPQKEQLSRGEMTAQSVYGNQAILRMLGGGSAGEPSMMRKQACDRGGSCTSGKGIASNGQSHFNFFGDLDDGVFKFAPDIRKPPSEMAKFAKALVKCKNICDSAYADPSLNKGGGGVVCEGTTKCACVFDVPPLTRGQCPDFDEVVFKHESRHVSEGDCPDSPGLSRLGPKDPSTLTATECKHRKESIKEIDDALPKAAGACKTGMTTIRGRLDTWVKANC